MRTLPPASYARLNCQGLVVLGIALLLYFAMFAPAQTGAGRVVGEVTAVDAAARQLTVKSDAGGEVKVQLDEKAALLRVPPGEKDLTKAARISLAEISPGDRVLARGSTVIVMSRAELAEKHDRDRAEWLKRGVAGTVVSVDPAANEFTIATRPRGQVTVEAAGAGFRRYAPDSVRFRDARPSSLAELRPGDQVRVLGDRDGDRLKAEQVVSGSFRTVAATVNAVEGSRIRAIDLETKKSLEIRVTGDSTLRRMPEQMAETLSRTRAASNGAGRGPALSQMLERMPPLTLSELKRGEPVLFSVGTGGETAIVLLAGVEPLLRSGAGEPQPGGAWTFDIGLP